jgi:ubiquinone/menaquinone biosynthesis C-methylase UbiE
MKLNAAERLLVNNGARALMQHFYEAPLLRHLGGPIAGCCVLEVGCGRGIGIELLVRQFQVARVYGIDLDPRQIERARKRLAGKYTGRVMLNVGSVEELPFMNASFDAVFDFGILHHVPAWQTSVAEIRRVLKPGGTFFFEEVTRAALERWLYRTFLEHPAENRFSEADFLAELARHALEPTGEIRRVLFSDIFIGAAKLTRPGNEA